MADTQNCISPSGLLDLPFQQTRRRSYRLRPVPLDLGVEFDSRWPMARQEKLFAPMLRTSLQEILGSKPVRSPRSRHRDTVIGVALLFVSYVRAIQIPDIYLFFFSFPQEFAQCSDYPRLAGPDTPSRSALQISRETPRCYLEHPLHDEPCRKLRRLLHLRRSHDVIIPDATHPQPQHGGHSLLSPAMCDENEDSRPPWRRSRTTIQ